MNKEAMDDCHSIQKRADTDSLRYLEERFATGNEGMINALISIRMLSCVGMVHSLATLKGKKRPSLYKFLRGTVHLWFLYRKEDKKRHLLK